MSARSDFLDTALDNVAEQIALITAHPKPTYSDGSKSISWSEHLTNLLTQQENLYKARQLADGPFEIRSWG